MPRKVMGRIAYTLAEIRAMTPAERQAVREAHRLHAAVHPGEVDPEFDARATAELDRQMHERLARERAEQDQGAEDS